jgi:hypothetical protein
MGNHIQVNSVGGVSWREVYECSKKVEDGVETGKRLVLDERCQRQLRVSAGCGIMI